MECYQSYSLLLLCLFMILDTLTLVERTQEVAITTERQVSITIIIVVLALALDHQ